MTLHVLYIIPYYLPDVSFGGPVFSVSALCENLVLQGHVVSVYTIGYDKSISYPYTTTLNGVQVHYFECDKGRPCQISRQLWKSVAIHANDFDVVHVQTWWNILIFRSLMLLKNKKPQVVLSPRGMMSDYSFSHRKTFIKKLFQKYAGTKLLKGVHLHATSSAEAKEMSVRCHRMLDSVHVIPNLLNLHIADSTSEVSGKFKIGFLSRLHHKKGIEVLLDAVAECDFIEELVIGGRGDEAYEKQLLNQIDQLGIQHKVRLVGWVHHTEKLAFFKQFHIMVLPSFNENFANVVVEAWAAGKPVIISNEVGLSDYVDRYQVGWLCNSTVESVKQTFKTAYSESEYWGEMAENALNLVHASFSDTLIVKEYETMYKKMVRPQEYAHADEQQPWQQTAHAIASSSDLYVLGLNAHHADASAALYKNGHLIAAMEEERFRRIKHWAGFPTKAIQYCLQEAGIKITDVQHIAVGRNASAKLFSKAKFLLQYPDAFIYAVKGRLSNAGQNLSVEEAILGMAGKQTQYQPRIEGIEHHRSHLASAYYPSSFQKAALLSVDGSGDFTTTMMAVGEGLNIQVLQTVDFPHSLGVFYTAFTQLLGFYNYGDEYKIMGLAAYGEPVYYDQLHEVIIWQEEGGFKLDTQCFRTPQKGYVHYDRDHRPTVAMLYSDALLSKFGEPRLPNEPLTQHHKNIAASVQKMLEETIFYMLNWLHHKTGLTQLCLAGGIGQNSLANGKITQRTPFTEVYIPTAAHDAGLAMGAALYWQHQHLSLRRQNKFQATPYLGKSWSQGEIGKLLAEKEVKHQFYTNFDKLCQEVVDCICDGGVVGWFRGRCEFGPRALGNRSILADPRRSDASEILNIKIKRRESFRPFAPAVLADMTHEWFENPTNVPYMEKVLPILPSKHASIPAVVHADGTGRLQTVSAQSNPDFYALITAFYERTGVPILLNTSFNENEPIVNSPLEALDCFSRTKMDILVLENYVVKRVNNI